MKILDIIKYEYGLTTEEAKKYLKTIDNKTKEELKKGFYKNAKKSFFED